MKSYNLREINRVATGLAAAEFTAKFPRPFLIGEDSQSTIDVDSSQTMGLCYMPTQVASHEAIQRIAYEVTPTEIPGVETVTLGRVPGNDILIDDPSVSKHHARLVVKSAGAGLEVIDVGSRNGTQADGQRLSPDIPVEFKSGTMITFGRVPLRFVSPEELYLYLKALRAKGEL